MLSGLFSYGCPEDVAPFITDDKLQFVLSRWLQSWLGGVYIRRALNAHIKVNVLQVVVFLVPPGLGAGLSVVDLELHVKAVVFGFSVVALVVVLQSIVFLLRRNHQAPRRGTRKSIDDTDTHVTNKLFSSLLLDMLFPPKRLLDETIGLSLTFCMAGLVMQLLSERDLGAYASMYANCGIVENVLGWTVYATAQYPMSAKSPVDVNTWRVGAPSALDDVQRAVYVTGLAGLDWIFKTVVPSALTARLVVRYCLYATPLLLNFGVLPPTTALLEYIVEQALGVGFGHMPCEDAFLLLMYTVAYAVATGLVAASTSAPLPVSLGLAAALGRWLASSRLRSWKEALTREILMTTSPKVVPFAPDHERTMVSEADLKASMGDLPKPWRHTLLHDDRVLATLRYVFVIVLSAGAGAGFASLSDSERDQCGICLLGLLVGLWVLVQLRVFVQAPTSTRVRRWSCWIPDGLLNAVGRALDRLLRLVLLLLLGCFLARDASTTTCAWTPCTAAYSWIAMVHAYTISQRHPCRATYIIALASLGALCANLSFAIALFLAAFVPPRFWHGLELLQYMRVVVSSAVFEPKQRFDYWILITLLATPISLLSLLLATILVSPLFPFCGSTLFLAGFPRPRRFWGSYETWHDGEDACYYEHFFDALTLELPSLLGPASVLHQRSHQGGNDVYLLRVDSFLGLLEVLELSTDYCVVRFKGLELQETTSCHHLEASKLDDVIADAFDEANPSEDDAPPRLPSPRTFTPLLRTPIRMYNISSVTLADFLDDPKCLDLIHEAFFVTLVSELNRVTHGCVPEIWLSFPVSISGLDFVLKEFPTLYWDFLQSKNKKLRHLQNPRDLLKTDEMPVPTPTPPSREPRRSSLKLAADAILRLVTHLKPVRVSVSTAPKARASVSAPLQRTPSQKERFEIAYGLDDTEAASVDYVSLAKQRPTVVHGRRSFLWGDIESHEEEPTTFVNPGVAVRASFLKDRWNKVTEFHLLAASCFAIVETLGFGVHEKRGPSHIFDCFQGNFPRSLENDWLQANTTLYDVVVRAYRLAVKIGLDKFAQGDTDLYDTPDELEATIHHYQSKWHIGPRHTAAWKHYITTNRPNLFALTKNANGHYMSNVYTLGRQDATLVALNRAACEGTWHGLALELLYMANDDDERFSIQSNSQLLRNLLVQSADPPLGYPVYATGAVFIKLQD